MQAIVMNTPGPIDSAPLCLQDLPVPQPGAGEVRVRVAACAVCRTDLHVVEGDLPRGAVGVGVWFGLGRSGSS